MKKYGKRKNEKNHNRKNGEREGKLKNREGTPRRLHLIFNRGWESTRRKKVKKCEIRKVGENPYETNCEREWKK